MSEKSISPPPARPSPAMSTATWGLLLVLSVLWGGTFFFSKIALSAVPPLTLVLARVTIGAFGLLAWMLATGVAIPRNSAVWRAFLAMGLLNNVLPFGLIFWGQSSLPQEIATSLASILNATTPVFGVVIAHFLTCDEKLNLRKTAGVVLGFAGVAVMLAPRMTQAVPTGDHGLAGMAACLAAAVIYGFAGIFGRRFKAMAVTPVQTAFGQLGGSSAIMVPLALAVDHPWQLPVPGGVALAAVLALALVSTSVAFVLYFRILATAGATNLLLVTFLIPVSAVLLGTLVLGEQLAMVHIAGMALIGLGLAAIDGRLARTLLNRSA